MSYFRKTTVFYFILLIFISACSKDDNRQDRVDEIFMSAKIDGIEHHMNSRTSSITARRVVETTGILKLEVEAISEDGQAVRFTIPAYSGKSLYTIGDNYMLPSFIEYSRVLPYGNWYCEHPGANESDKNYIEIISDDGEILEGKFSFTGLNPDDNTFRKITEGKFKVITD